MAALDAALEEVEKRAAAADARAAEAERRTASAQAAAEARPPLLRPLHI